VAGRGGRRHRGGAVRAAVGPGAVRDEPAALEVEAGHHVAAVLDVQLVGAGGGVVVVHGGAGGDHVGDVVLRGEVLVGGEAGGDHAALGVPGQHHGCVWGDALVRVEPVDRVGRRLGGCRGPVGPGQGGVAGHVQRVVSGRGGPLLGPGDADDHAGGVVPADHGQRDLPLIGVPGAGGDVLDHSGQVAGWDQAGLLRGHGLGCVRVA